MIEKRSSTTVRSVFVNLDKTVILYIYYYYLISKFYSEFNTYAIHKRNVDDYIFYKDMNTLKSR